MHHQIVELHRKNLLTPVFLTHFCAVGDFCEVLLHTRLLLPVSTSLYNRYRRFDSPTSNTNVILLVLFDANNQSNQVPVPITEQGRIPKHHEARTRTYIVSLYDMNDIFTI